MAVTAASEVFVTTVVSKCILNKLTEASISLLSLINFIGPYNNNDEFNISILEKSDSKNSSFSIIWKQICKKNQECKKSDIVAKLCLIQSLINDYQKYMEIHHNSISQHKKSLVVLEESYCCENYIDKNPSQLLSKSCSTNTTDISNTITNNPELGCSSIFCQCSLLATTLDLIINSAEKILEQFRLIKYEFDRYQQSWFYFTRLNIKTNINEIILESSILDKRLDKLTMALSWSKELLNHNSSSHQYHHSNHQVETAASNEFKKIKKC